MSICLALVEQTVLWLVRKQRNRNVPILEFTFSTHRESMGIGEINSFAKSVPHFFAAETMDFN